MQLLAPGRCGWKGQDKRLIIATLLSRAIHDTILLPELICVPPALAIVLCMQGPPSSFRTIPTSVGALGIKEESAAHQSTMPGCHWDSG